MNEMNFSLSRSAVSSFRFVLYWVCWLFGIVFGILVAFSCDELHFSLMCRAFLEPVSIVPLLSTLFLPLVIYSISVHFHKPFILYFAVLLKGLGYSFFLSCISSSFYDAYWLVAVLFLFSDTFMLLPVLWLWYRGLYAKKAVGKRWLLCYICLAVFVGSLDYFVISPFFCRLLSIS